MIGPNGAGKTTFFNVLTGLYTPDGGRFELGGKPYAPSSVHQVAQAGIARTFQNIRLFAEMTALENVMVGRHVRTRSGLLGAVFRSSRFKAEEEAIAQRATELLDYVGIGRFASYKARTLSYGDQRRLEIARALATDPKPAVAIVVRELLGGDLLRSWPPLGGVDERTSLLAMNRINGNLCFIDRPDAVRVTDDGRVAYQPWE